MAYAEMATNGRKSFVQRQNSPWAIVVVGRFKKNLDQNFGQGSVGDKKKWVKGGVDDGIGNEAKGGCHRMSG